MQYYPVFLNLKNRVCVVAGGGDVAIRKVRTLVKAGARTVLVSPEIRSTLRIPKQVKVIKSKIQPKHLDGAFLAILATDDNALNVRMGRYCQRKKILVNVADVPQECVFIAPSIISRGNFTLAISSGGVSSLSKSFRKFLQRRIPRDIGKFQKLAEKVRNEVRRKVPKQKARARILLHLFSPKTVAMLNDSGYDKTAAWVKKELRRLLS